MIARCTALRFMVGFVIMCGKTGFIECVTCWEIDEPVQND